MKWLVPAVFQLEVALIRWSASFGGARRARLSMRA